VQAKKAEAEDGLKKISARQERREITAPVDGVAMNMRLFTQGAVVSPGGALIDIVPVGEKLLIEARLKPTDIDVVRPDLQASVRFIAYKQRSTPSVQGRVVRVSADIMQDERSRESFYAATIEVTSESLARLPQVRLYPGMPVEVAIVTGERSMLAYLLQPLLDSMSHSFREE
jgi:HlyD family secretion protein